MFVLVFFLVFVLVFVLVFLCVFVCLFEGRIPTEVALLTALQALSLSENSLTGIKMSDCSIARPFFVTSLLVGRGITIDKHPNTHSFTLTSL